MIFTAFWCCSMLPELLTLISWFGHTLQCTIAHALEKTKYPDSDIYWKNLDDKYHFSCQFTADLIAMNHTDFIITSTFQEIAGRWDLSFTNDYVICYSSDNLTFLLSIISVRTLLVSMRVTLLSLFLDSTVLYMVLMCLIPSSTLYLLVLIWAFTSPTLRRREGWSLSIPRLRSCFTAMLRIRNTCEFASTYMCLMFDVWLNSRHHINCSNKLLLINSCQTDVCWKTATSPSCLQWQDWTV